MFRVHYYEADSGKNLILCCPLGERRRHGDRRINKGQCGIGQGRKTGNKDFVHRLPILLLHTPTHQHNISCQINVDIQTTFLHFTY